MPHISSSFFCIFLGQFTMRYESRSGSLRYRCLAAFQLGSDKTSSGIDTTLTTVHTFCWNPASPQNEFETENMIRLSCIETIQKPEALWVLGAFFCSFLPLGGFAVRLCGRLCRRHGQQSLWRDQNAAAGKTSSVVPWNGVFSILNVSRVGSWT